MLALIDAGATVWHELKMLCKEADESMLVPLSEVTIYSPIPRPRQNVICLGLNYV